MKIVLYTFVLIIVLFGEAVVFAVICVLFENPHKYAFYGGCILTIVLLLVNAEIIRWSIKYIDSKYPNNP